MEVQPRSIKSCKRESNSSIVDRLPRELFFQILLKLPDVKTLLRCTSVCKSWYFLVKSHDFFSAHLNQKILPFSSTASSGNKNDGRLLFIRLVGSGLIRCFMDFEAKGFDEGRDLPVLSFSRFNSVCCCNGLVCFSHTKKDAVILWNPSIKKTITLPRSQLHRPLHRRYRRYQYDWRRETGLGFDPRTNDYRILRIVQLKLYGPRPCVFRWVEVYSLNSASWKKVNPFPSEIPILSTDPTPPPVFANGSLHFVGVETIKEQPEGRLVILRFGLDDGGVNKIALPETLSVITGERKLVIMEYKSSIAVADKILKEGACDVWVMKKYCKVDSWTKIFTIQDAIKIHAYIFRRGEGMMLVRRRDGNIYSMDPGGKQVNLLASNWRIRHVSCYVESLALLNNGRRRIRDATQRATRKPAYLKDYDLSLLLAPII